MLQLNPLPSPPASSLGVPSYNDAREAYGLSRFASFSEITSATTVQEILADAHGNDVDLLDAYTGALAETEDGSGLFAGPLLRVSEGGGSA